MSGYPIIGEGGQHDRKAIPLATKKGRWINNTRRLERAPEALREAARQIRDKFPALQLRSLSATYNCFGMVFACRRTCVLDHNEVLKILHDDEYVEVKSREAVEVGDIVLYRQQREGEIKHVGIVVEKRPAVSAGGSPTFMVLSQWGADGEWVHHEATVLSAFGTVREFYSERKNHGVEAR
jgi:hypothetical protein